MQLATVACPQCQSVTTQSPASLEYTEIEALDWVNSQILKLRNTYGVAFEGLKDETLPLFMNLDKIKAALKKKEKYKIIPTPKSKRLTKN